MVVAVHRYTVCPSGGDGVHPQKAHRVHRHHNLDGEVHDDGDLDTNQSAQQDAALEEVVVRGAHEEESVGDDTEGTQHHRVIREGFGDRAVGTRWYQQDGMQDGTRERARRRRRREPVGESQWVRDKNERRQ